MNIVGLLGSPSAESRSASLLAAAQVRLARASDELPCIAVRDLPAQALLRAEFEHPRVQEALALVAAADLLLVATPIYKASFSGVLKAFLDLLPQAALRGKTVLPLATGGSIAHLLALDYALKPVLGALGARDILDAVYATDAQVPRDAHGRYAPLPEVTARIDASLQPVLDRLGRGPTGTHRGSAEREAPPAHRQAAGALRSDIPVPQQRPRGIEP